LPRKISHNLVKKISILLSFFQFISILVNKIIYTLKIFSKVNTYKYIYITKDYLNLFKNQTYNVMHIQSRKLHKEKTKLTTKL